MNIQAAKEEIKRTLRAYTERTEDGVFYIPPVRQRPVLLMGPPGIGKTAIMSQIAKEEQVGLVSYTMTHHTRQSAVGLPMIKEKLYHGKTCSITEYTMSEIVSSIYECMERTGFQSGILFIDEINCVSETLAPVMLQLLQNKMFGNHQIPEGWLITAAGNPPEYNKSVRDFDMVTLDRVKTINIEADLLAWKQYACEHSIHPSILAFVNLYPDSFYLITSEDGFPAFVTARGWEDLSQILYAYERHGNPVSEELILQYLHHQDSARNFFLFYELFRHLADKFAAEQYFSPAVYDRIRQGGPSESIALAAILFARISADAADYDFNKRQLDGFKRHLDLFLSMEKNNLLEGSSECEHASDYIRRQKDANHIKDVHGLLPLEEKILQDRIMRHMEDLQNAAQIQTDHTFSDLLLSDLNTKKEELASSSNRLLKFIDNSRKLLADSPHDICLSYFEADLEGNSFCQKLL